MKDINRSYKIIRSDLRKYPNFGTCTAIDRIQDEGLRCRVKKHFLNNKPSEKLHHEFYENVAFTGGLYWWAHSDEGLEQRVLFVEKMLLITTSIPFWKRVLYLFKK